MEDSLQTELNETGQPYIDVPVYVAPKSMDGLRLALSLALGKCIEPPSPILTGHQRYRLRWKKPEDYKREPPHEKP